MGCFKKKKTDVVLRISYDGSLFRCQKKENSVTNQSEESNYNLSGDGGWLTAFGDLESLGLVFADAKQHNGGVEGCSDFYLLQQVINHLDLLPAGTQQHCNGLHTNTSTQQEARIQKSERHTKYTKTQHALPHGSPVWMEATAFLHSPLLGRCGRCW